MDPSMASTSAAAPQEERTQPRRRKDGHDDQPLFLRKAFSMITECPEHLGGWSEAGDSFIVKDIVAFASTIIPTVYKHNNWASFVRQLNFYGFRKIKAEKLNQNTWWEFKHALFLRGQPHLLCEIKRLNHFEDAPVSSVGIVHLQNEVTQLRSKIDTMNESLAGLSGQMAKLSTANASFESDGGKKRKVANSSYVSQGNNNDFSNVWGSPEGEGIMQDELMDQDMWGLLDSLGSDDVIFEADADAPATVKVEPEAPPMSPHSIATVSSATVPSASVNTETESSPPAAISMDEVSRVLTALDPSLQARFVDKLAESFGNELAKTFQPAVAVGSAVEPTTSSSNVSNVAAPSEPTPAAGAEPEAASAVDALSPANICTFINKLVEISGPQPAQMVDQVQLTTASKEAAFHSRVGQVAQGCH